MSEEDKSRKTEQPTPRKLREARKKGQVARSQEVVSAALIISVFIFYWLSWTHQLELFKELILLPINFLYTMPFDQALKRLLDLLFEQFIILAMPLVGVVIAMGLLANILQFGVLFAAEPLKPDLNKINPVQGFKKIFSVKTFVELIKSILKIAFLSLLLYFIIMESLSSLVHVPHCGVSCLIGALAALLKQVVLYTTPLLIIIAVADLFFQKSQFIKQQKMTKDEVKREHKDMEGDPQIKGQRKQLHRQLSAEDTLKRIKVASVLVTDSTTLAVALRYDPEETPLPMIQALSKDMQAKRLIGLAQAENIPIVEQMTLARELSEKSDVDQYIPAELIEATAEVLHRARNLKQQSL